MIAADAQTLHRLDDVTVTARRPLKEIGLVKSEIDSLALKENIAQSMADVISFGSSVFVKTSGRATLSTVAFRGTAASHTEVTWNGLSINSPSLGMTDFSLIPAYFIDKAQLFYGPSSTAVSSGAIGGVVDLSSVAKDIPRGWTLQYVQGIGSFLTFDEFLKVSYGGSLWKTSTRVSYSSSRNDFKFVNHDKKENIYDENHQIIGQYYPTEKNRNGRYGDLHILQQLAFTPNSHNSFDLDLWYTNSQRQIPLTTVDYLTERKYRREQRENTLRAALSYRYNAEKLMVDARLGYIHSHMHYDYAIGMPVELNPLISSRTNVNTWNVSGTSEWRILNNLHLTGNLTFTHNHVTARDDASMTPLGYDKARADVSAAVTLRWQAVERLGLSATLRESTIGKRFSPVTPAITVDFLAWRAANLTLKGSFARNFHAPTLNDLYFVPGGNPDLKDEKSLRYDLGLSAGKDFGKISLSGEATWFDSYVDDWILWLPTIKGFFSPQNVKKVHSSGIELSANFGVKFRKDLGLNISGHFARTASVNTSPAISEGDKSYGKQLPYIPLYTASARGILQWRGFEFLLKWCYYSTRYTMSSNESSVSGSLPPYSMVDASVAHNFDFRPLNLSLKFAVNNLLNADYQTVMSHPMPGINFEFFIGITPKI
ncbi:MAG: TonB-dependent receptor [Muribaculaceae bacterium]|nr:TonB-dependent receptor [Muribaculaceae bacterium]